MAPFYAILVLCAARARAQQVVIGYTSFEEPEVTGGTAVPRFYDAQSGDVDHRLRGGHPGQNPVEYLACSKGAAELGFATYYENTEDCANLPYQSTYCTNGMTDGAKVGVIGDATTTMRGDNDKGGVAPDGTQYYMMSDTDGFLHMRLDPVDVTAYTDVEMRGWVFVRSSSWEERDLLKMWATDSPSEHEVVLVEGTDLDEPATTGNITEDVWVQYSAPLPNFVSVTMSCGVHSDSSLEHVVFDNLQVLGTGPGRSAMYCQGCSGGMFREAGAEVCQDCAAGQFSQDSSAICQLCAEGTYSSSAASMCSSCPADLHLPPVGQQQQGGAVCSMSEAGSCGANGLCSFGNCRCTNGFVGARCDQPNVQYAVTSYTGSTAMQDCRAVPRLIGYTSFEEPTIAGGTTVPMFTDSLDGTTGARSPRDPRSTYQPLKTPLSIHLSTPRAKRGVLVLLVEWPDRCPPGLQINIARLGVLYELV